ncbi:hypothetical protein Tco_0970411 [Tanacetum coccineum]
MLVASNTIWDTYKSASSSLSDHCTPKLIRLYGALIGTTLNNTLGSRRSSALPMRWLDLKDELVKSELDWEGLWCWGCVGVFGVGVVKGAIPSKIAVDAKVAIQEMAEYSQKWPNGTSSRTRSTETSNGLDAIEAQLNNLGREIKKVNEKVYAAQVGCELCKGRHYTKDCPQKEEGSYFGRSKEWWMNEGNGNISTWEELVKKIFKKFYPLPCSSNYDKMCNNDEEGRDPLEFIPWRNSKFKDHKKVDKTTKRALLYTWIEIGKEEGLLNDKVSSDEE